MPKKSRKKKKGKKIKKRKPIKRKKKVSRKTKKRRSLKPKKRKIKRKVKPSVSQPKEDREKIYKTKSEWIKKALVTKSLYEKKYNQSLKENESFWRKEGKRISWIKP